MADTVPMAQTQPLGTSPGPSRSATSAGVSAAARWYAMEADAVVGALGSDTQSGLSHVEAERRLSRDGANEIAQEEPPSVWAIALGQLRDPRAIDGLAAAMKDSSADVRKQAAFALGEIRD